MSSDVDLSRDDDLKDALYRTQMAVSTAVFFDDVVAAIVAGAVALSGAQRGALWLREAEALNLGLTLGGLSTDSSAQNATDDVADSNSAVEAQTWICVLSHTISAAGAASVQRHNRRAVDDRAEDESGGNDQAEGIGKADVQSTESQNIENQNAAQANRSTSALPSSPMLDVPLTNAVQNAIRGASASSASASSASAENTNLLNASERDAAFPLLKNGRVIGVLQIAWNAGVSIEPDNRVLELFCDHAAVALANARLFEQLESAKSEWETTFDGMIDGVCIERADGTILRANHVAAAIFGRTFLQMTGCTRRELHALLPAYEELRALSPVAGDATGRDVQSSEFRFGGPPRIFLETVFALPIPPNSQKRSRPVTRGDDRRRVVRILRDITEQRRLEEQLIQSEKLAALGELISGVAHELNNPLTSVTGYAQLLQDDQSIPLAARRQIEYIYEEASRAARIVSNLLAFVRREDTRRDVVDVNQSLRSLGQMLAYQLQAENVRLQFEYANDLPPVVGDSHQLQQVLLNVISNAQQALHAWRGGGTISIETKRVSVGGAAGVLISICDNGPGIAPEHLRRLFDPFWTTKQAGEGTGLGMSISLGIISRHGGRIWAESTLGHGAQFHIELPGASEGENADAEPELESSTRFAGETSLQVVDDEPTAGAQILVVDDEEPVIFLMSEILGLDDHEITPAFNGGEALALLQERDFDLIISDVRMPAVGGPTFFEILQTTRPDLLPRVVFVTGDTMSRSTQEFLHKAGRPMLAKPFSPERLRALVREQLEQNR